ncbi:MAG TPA: TonB-dependent receptor [Opitutaceae bacterium]|nr:TonB-dependent receptor [Opitutaceae bacterium]
MNLNSVRKLRAALAFVLGAALPSFAFAQDNAAAAPAGQNNQTVQMQKFVVTGSYLPESQVVTASPVVTVEAADLDQSGATDALRLVRQMTPFFSGNGNQGTEANNGAAGESYVALRNLTTLVLINGQRITGSAFQSGSLVDLNIIPTAMIDRVEVLKDGASTIYGTDAIGGVVNVILKKDYNGFEMGTRYGTTGNGDYKTKEVYLVGGASGSGYSLTVGAQHFENVPLLTTSRPLTTLTPTDEAAMGFNPTSAVFSGTYPGRVNSDVLAGSTLIATGATGFNAAITSPGIKSSPNDTSVTGGFTGAAALTYLEGKGVYLPVSGTPIGKAAGGATALNTTLFGNPLIENTKRNQFVLNGDRELMGKNLVVFGDFLFSQTINGGSALAPSPIAGVGPGGGNTLFIPANNPYNVFNVDFPGPLSARQRTIELGERSSINETNTWRFVGGLRGQINDQYSWEVNYNYSRSSLLERILGGVNGANMNSAMVPLLNSSGGYVYNSAGKPLSTLTDSQGNNLPVYNYFALPGFNDPATLAALATTLFNSGDASLRNIQALIRGTPFTVPAGNVDFALGVEARHEDVSSSVDALFANGLALGYNPANTFAGGSRDSKGAFLEVGVPVTSAKMNLPAFYSVNLNLADRYEKIEPGGHANSPKIGLKWNPVDDSFVLRATYAKGFIAPTIVNLFGPAVGNSPTFAVLQGNGSASPGGSLGNMTTVQGSTNQLSNPNLPPSNSKSYTFGFVYSPKDIKGLSVSVDYYKITQDKVGGLDYTSIVADLNAKGSGSAYAPGFIFADGSTLKTTTANQVTSTNFGFLNVTNNPSGDQWTNGLDIAIDYNFKTANLGRFDVGAQANILFNYYFRPNPSSPYFQYARNFTDGTNGLGGTNGLLPGYVIKPYINHAWGPLATSLFFNYVPPTTASGSMFGGQSTTNTDRIDGKPYTIPRYFTVDLGITYTLPNFGQHWLRNTTVTLGANNLLNKMAPYVPVDGNPPGENNTVESQYDIIGRFMFVDLKKAF